MRKLIIAIAIVLTGCVTNPVVKTHTDQLNAYSAEMKAKNDAGTIKRSTAYEQLYSKTFELNQAIGVTRYRVYLSEIIPIAKSMEAGQITADQFEDERRKRHAVMMQGIDADNRTNEAQRQANMDSTLRSLAANPVLQPAPPMRQPTTCSSQWIGNQWRTVCN